MFDGRPTFFDGSPHSIYRRQLKYILENGEHVRVRGHDTLEILNAVTFIPNPRRRVSLVPGRHINPWNALSEALWILAGRNDVAAIRPYNKNIASYSDDGVTLYGAYGTRIANQIPALLERLTADSTDRRAVLQIWDMRDLTAATKDPPCNQQLHFKLRSGRLHMTVINRSNDLHLGLHAVNIPTLSILLEYLAARLGVETGTQTHLSNSLHVYTDDIGQPITDRMLAAMEEPLPELPVSYPLFWAGVPEHREFVAHCNEILAPPHGHCEFNELPFLEFAADFLACYKERRDPASCRFANIYADWVLAGQDFLDWRNSNRASAAKN